MSSHLHVAVANASEPDVARFLTDHVADMAPTAPPESQHALDLQAYNDPRITLWVGRIGSDIAGTVAMHRFEPGNVELKSMRTSPQHRGKGIARKMLAHAIHAAREEGATHMWLETGSMEFFAAARALYASEGFVECEPFGKYRIDPHSTYMVKDLTLE